MKKRNLKGIRIRTLLRTDWTWYYKHKIYMKNKSAQKGHE